MKLKTQSSESPSKGEQSFGKNIGNLSKLNNQSSILQIEQQMPVTNNDRSRAQSNDDSYFGGKNKLTMQQQKYASQLEYGGYNNQLRNNSSINESMSISKNESMPRIKNIRPDPTSKNSRTKFNQTASQINALNCTVSSINGINDTQNSSLNGAAYGNQISNILGQENGRIKMLKRYTLKTKAANVLQKIGFPQKKYKIQEELRKIKKEIGGKMESDNNEFFELLNQTTQSFYKTLNESVMNQNPPDISTSYYGQQSAARDYSDAEETKYNSTRNFERPQYRPATQLKTRDNKLQFPNNLQKTNNAVSQRDTSLKSKNKTLDKAKNFSIPEEGLNTISNNSQQNLNTTISNIKSKLGIRPITSVQERGGSSMKTDKNVTIKLNYYAIANISGNAQIQTITKNNIFNRPRGATMDSIRKRPVVRPNKNPNEQSNDSQSNLFQTHHDMMNSIFEGTTQVGRNRSISDEKKTTQNMNAEDKSNQYLEKRSNSRISFKRSRVDLYNQNMIQQFERQFDSIRGSIGGERIQYIKSQIVQAYEIAQFPMYQIDERKTCLIDIWNTIIETIKQSNDLSTFELLFSTQRVLGNFYLDFKDLNEAVRVYKSLKILCEDFQKYKEKMHVYEQIGYVYRLMKDSESAVKQFKKQLQLAWQEGDTQVEVNAYDNLSIDYFYLGELAKSNYYHDRIMRGKTENNKSIVKKVSCNLLVSRREHRHNIELRKNGEKQKTMEQQRLPSPSAISKGAQFSKAINLLPHYTESQALGIKEEEDEELNYSKQRGKTTDGRSQGKKFTQKELLHLNKLPQYEYLKTQIEKKTFVSKKNFYTKLQQAENKGVYRQEEPVDYKPFDEDRFRDIVSYALQKKETSHTTDDKRNISHMSVHRTAPLNVFNPIKIIESLKRTIEAYAARLVQLAAMDKLIKQRDSPTQKML
ncbi:histidine acid phosphatase family protein [Stylonychia lemnae]|uniref:Histidine acid phosphatase family protein n=1 Tax=Stylonychia lemnae TaxID=5949 RepID=A0A078ACZ9_STYLE|nr:histidine acid phosphatase family protein [Stylonychia lemnae]|eukprot:CDW80099.1 histidine acid phosphatase family protein [Stylonychia lemnae]